MTVAVPITLPSRSTSTTSPAPSAVEIEPLRVGEVSLLAPPVATMPCVGSTLSWICRISTVWLTEEVLTVKLRLLEAALLLPAASTTCAV
ncbi:hypothetical protein D3C84_860010 [compost metagenome]